MLDSFYRAFVAEQRYLLYLDGLKVTILVSVIAILIGVALGSMAVKYCREVLIVATSLIGGVMSGVSLAKLGNLEDIPYGLGMSVGFAVLGMLIQFAINKPVSDEEYAVQDEYNTQDQRMPQNSDMQGYRPQGENRTEYSEKMRNREKK